MSTMGTSRALTAVNFIRLIRAVVVPITHPLDGNAAPVSTAMLLCGVAVWRKQALRGWRTNMSNTGMCGLWRQYKLESSPVTR